MVHGDLAGIWNDQRRIGIHDDAVVVVDAVVVADATADDRTDTVKLYLSWPVAQ